MTSQPPAEKSWARQWLPKIILTVLGLVAAVLIFTLLIPQFGNFAQGWEAALAIPREWLIVIVIGALISIFVYPLTAPAAIPGLAYKPAFIDRQAGFSIATGVPWGGGAIAVGVQYSILARYGVPQRRAAAAVAADAVWTYLMTFGTPALALIALFAIERRTIDGQFELIAVIAAIIFAISTVFIAIILRSEAGARRVGTWAQGLISWVFRLIHKAPPDVVDSVVGFHDTAAEMVSTRWKQLTITNAAAQFAPFIVLIGALYGTGAFDGDLTVLEAVVAFSVALLLASVPIAPGGLGTVDAALIALLITFGASSAQATAADIIWRAFAYFPQMLVGFGALLYFFADRKRLNAKEISPAE
ncbi:MAG: flippase-like domain-containing protein [Candidatus Nanopelagicales bacterium]